MDYAFAAAQLVAKKLARQDNPAAEEGAHDSGERAGRI
jgi:hypothetical protein